MKNILVSSFVLIIFLFLSSCQKNKFDVDISDIDVDITIKRLDRDLFSVSEENITADIKNLEQEYGKFFDLYNHQIIGIGGSDKAEYPEILNKFLNYNAAKVAHSSVGEKFPDITEVESSLENAFRYYKYYYPEKEIPKVYTFVSGFTPSLSIAADEGILGIDLDKYLGVDFEVYKEAGFEAYRRKKMGEERIIPDCMSIMFRMEFEYNDSIDNVLSNMIYAGKELYFLNAMMPKAGDAILTGYSEDEINWCKSNEDDMWDLIIDNKILFSTDFMLVKQLVEDGPYTRSFSTESPSKAGCWIGWQIVKAYMDQNPELTLNDLMNEHDYQKILNYSRYNP